MAYFFTTSGGPIGFLSLLIITALFYAWNQDSIKERALVFVKSILAFVVFFGVCAFVNEHYTKLILKEQRPSHVFMLQQTGMLDKIDSLYLLTKKQRSVYFGDLIQKNPVQFRSIDARVKNHWIEEAGFSFPSGHTFNAFLFATIIAFSIYYNRRKPQLQNLFFIPFVWAFCVGVSRVAMGAHTAFDVSIGALMGISIGTLFLYIDKTRHLLTRKKLF